jgi:hypothetical protein
MLRMLSVSAASSRFLRGATPHGNEGLVFDAQRVGDSADVVEVTNHLNRVMNRVVAKSVFTQNIQVLRPHIVLVMGQLGRERTKLSIDRRQ